MVPGTILGHEGVGVIEEIGPGVRNFKKGERVVIPSTIACGIVPTAVRDTIHNATTQIPTANWQVRHFSEGRR